MRFPRASLQIHTPHWCYHTYVLVYTGSSTWYRTLKVCHGSLCMTEDLLRNAAARTSENETHIALGIVGQPTAPRLLPDLLFQMHVKHRGMRFTQYGIMRWMPSAPAKRQRTESGGSPPPRVIRGGEPLGWPGDPAYWVGDDPFGEGGVWLKVRINTSFKEGNTDCGARHHGHHQTASLPPPQMTLSPTAPAQVPEEIAPASSRGSGDWWPEGWQQARRIESEADIFALLGLPYRSPPQRCAF